MRMKKIFTLIAMALVAAGAQAQAQLIQFSEAKTKGTAAGTYGDGTFKLTAVDTNANKLAIDENSAWFGTAGEQMKFSYRLKTGGKSDSNNNLSLAIPGAGKVLVYVRTGSNTATDRNIVLTQNETELYNQVVLESSKVLVKGLDSKEPEKETNVYPVIEVDVTEGTLAIAYPTNSLNFYGFQFVPTGSEPITGIQTVKADDAATGASYNLAGQKVGESYKGVVIKNGKKVVIK